jgi:RNA-directed DNA polymerase
VGFNPGVSNEAKRKMTRAMRRWQLHLKCGATLLELAKWVNPILRGWINYYGKFYRTALRPVLYHFNEILVKWAKRKYKRFKGHFAKAIHWLGRIAKANPNLFAHWAFAVKPPAK